MHQGAADERQLVAGRGHAARVLGRRDAALGDARHRPRQQRRELLEATGHDLKCAEVAAVDADEQLRAGREARHELVHQLDVGVVEGLEQYEQVAGAGAFDERLVRRARSMRRMISTPPAPAARASSTW